MDLGSDIAAAYTLWQQGVVPSEALVDAATQALVDGLDSPSLRELAGVRRDDAPHQAPTLCERALEELGLASADDFDARVALVRDHARRILSGELSARGGARAVWWAFSGAADDYPDLVAEMLGLEDEWDGGWGRLQPEIEQAIKAQAARILDVWGDPTSPVHRLHSAARRRLADRYDWWIRKYSALVERGGDRVDGGYTDEAIHLFPRYIVLEHILREVERSVPSQFGDTTTLRAALRAAATRGFDGSYVHAEPAAREETLDFLRRLDSDDIVPSPDLLPYRRTLSATEADRHAEELQARWGVRGRQWHPIIGADVPPDVVVVDADRWTGDEAVDALRAALRADGVSVVVVLTEDGIGFETATEAFDPSYSLAGEVLASSPNPWWLLYTSHEDTTAVSPGRLVGR